MKFWFNNENLWVHRCEWTETLAFKKFCHKRNCEICLLGKYSFFDNGKQISLPTGRVLGLFNEE